MNAIADVLVIGGGLHGLSAALHIARRNLSVVLLERHFLGRHASGATAAGVRTLGRDPAELSLSLEAAEAWHGIESLVGDHCGFRACGQLQVAEDELAFNRISARVRDLEARGLYHERLLTSDEVRELAPAMVADCVGAAWAGKDGAADPHRTIRAFREAARRAGVDIREANPVLGLSQERGRWRACTANGQVEANFVINAAGAWAGRVAELAGECLTHSIRTSMMIVTERATHQVGPVVSSFGRKLSFKQTAEGTLLIGGGAQGRLAADHNSATVDAVALSEPARSAARLFPWTSALRIVRTWAGMEAMTADHLPVIGESATHEGLIHVFGFSGHGFQLAPSVGRAVADLVTKGSSTHDLSAFGPSRVMSMGDAA